MHTELFQQLRTATPFVALPQDMKGLAEAAELAENLSTGAFAPCFWNTPERSALTSAQFVAMVISVLKKRGGRKGVDAALELIRMLEAANAY